MTHTTTMSGRLHYELIRRLVETCSIPSHEELKALLTCSSVELDHAFEELADLHGVVLHPSSHDVWAIHPFSLAPTPFLVESGDKKWWGNCAWCSLGVAVLVGEPSVITTTLGAENEQVQLVAETANLSRQDLVVHFPIPMVRAWDNVVYTCSTMLLFKDEEHVADWSARRRIPVGDIQPVAKVLELAQRWYGGYLRADWTKTERCRGTSHLCRARVCPSCVVLAGAGRQILTPPNSACGPTARVYLVNNLRNERTAAWARRYPNTASTEFAPAPDDLAHGSPEFHRQGPSVVLLSYCVGRLSTGCRSAFLGSVGRWVNHHGSRTVDEDQCGLGADR